MRSQLKNAKPSAGRAQYEIRDEKIGGLFVRVGKEAKTYALKYRHEGRSLRLTIGRYPDGSLLEAGNRAQDARSQIAKALTRGRSRSVKSRNSAIALTGWSSSSSRRSARDRILRNRASPFSSRGS